MANDLIVVDDNDSLDWRLEVANTLSVTRIQRGGELSIANHNVFECSQVNDADLLGNGNFLHENILSLLQGGTLPPLGFQIMRLGCRAS